MSASVELEWTAAEPVTELRAWAEARLFPALSQFGFRVVRGNDGAVVFARRRTAWWLAFFSVLAFWLSPDEKRTIIVSFERVGADSSRINVFGDVPPQVRKVLLDVPGCHEVFSR